MLPRQYIEINKLKIAYSDIGKGDPVLMVHGFALSSFTWERLLKSLPANKRYIMIDLKGFGYSDKTQDQRFSPLVQARLLLEFALKLQLKNLTLLGHSFGGAVCLLSLIMPPMKNIVSKLILIDSAGYTNQLPPFIRQLRIPLANNLIFNYINSEILAKAILEETYYDPKKIDEEYTREYAALLRLPGAIDCLIKSAQQISSDKPNKLSKHLKKLKLPTLIIWGEEDKFLPLQNAYQFKEDIADSQLVIIPRCGHAPQEENPDATGNVINDFLANRKVRTPEKTAENTPNMAQSVKSNNRVPAAKFTNRPRMRHLIDKWSPGIFLMFVFVKILQTLKSLGFKAKESGWRKTMGTYLRTEHSKFGLAVFGLDFLSDRGRIENLSPKEVREHLIKRLSEFLRDTPSSHWKLKWDRFMVFRERQLFVDIIEVEFAENGDMTKLTPFFDVKSPPFFKLDTNMGKLICETIIAEYNRVKNIRDEKRPLLLRNNLRKWIASQHTESAIAKQEMLSFVDRVLSGHSIIFQILDKKASGPSSERFTPPDFIRYKHAGYGLLNIFCRLNHSLDETDLWFQFQHVPVDGVPMQEFLQNLKKRWGIRHKLTYPALNSPEPMIPQRCSTDKKHRAFYQTATFLDFRPLLKLRKEINLRYINEMGGPATVVSLIMWGLTRHPALKGRKFIFPVELAECPISKQERAPCAMFIRPCKFNNPENRLKGFLDFQYEFNHRMNATRARKSESYEFIEIFAIIFPWIYTFTRKIMPHALAEFTGTVGITMIKDADLFITPLSDIQSEGFFAIGNLLVDTADNQKAGCVSIRAPKENIPQYVEALSQVQTNLEKLLET